jgi:outer membrane biosynthesis protein TonB
MNRGEKVEVKLIPRDKVTSRILAEALSIVGVEPRVAGYVSIELMDRLTPLLVESGMAQNEAITLATELKKATPAERERLLQSVGVPGETSARIIQIIEEEEEKAKVFKKPRKETPKPETEEEEKETETEKEGKARTRRKQKSETEPEESSEQEQVKGKSESTEESQEPEGFDTFFDDSNQ